MTRRQRVTLKRRSTKRIKKGGWRERSKSQRNKKYKPRSMLSRSPSRSNSLF